MFDRLIDIAHWHTVITKLWRLLVAANFKHAWTHACKWKEWKFITCQVWSTIVRALGNVIRTQTIGQH